LVAPTPRDKPLEQVDFPVHEAGDYRQYDQDQDQFKQAQIALAICRFQLRFQLTYFACGMTSAHFAPPRSLAAVGELPPHSAAELLLRFPASDSKATVRLEIRPRLAAQTI
jgi:hypothetical protein